jgi:hypothetical protein
LKEEDMQEHESKFFAIVSQVGLAVLLLASLGLKCNVQGTRPTNLPPLIRFANIPTQGSSFTSQPLLYWFGKDLDGFVAKYQYVVFKASQIQLLGYAADSTGVEANWISFLKDIPPDLWLDSLKQIGKNLESQGEEVVSPVELVTEGGAGQTNDRVKLFASADPSKIILQYIFLRAVDNAQAKSDVIYRQFFRTNNPPNSKILFDSKEIYYSLDDTTRTWNGIFISWGGTDSIDYPIGDPPLEFFWELFYLGPSSSDTLNPDTTDPLAISFDSEDGDKWVTTKTTSLPVGLQTGYYMFRERSRDDALIPDPTPATTIFYVIKPTFDKEVLLVDLTFFFTSYTGAVTNPDLYLPYYQQMFSLAGHPVDTTFGDVFNPDPNLTPEEPLLSRYKLVVVINQDPARGILDSLGRQLIKYLDVGGKIWLVGINNFTTAATFTPDKLRGTRTFLGEKSSALGKGESGYPAQIGMQYCGLESYFMPGWEDLADSVNCTNGSNCESNYSKWPSFPAGRNEEFTGAGAVVSAPWPALLEVDTVNVKLASTLDPDKKILFLDKAPRANYAVINSFNLFYSDLPPAEALYVVNSAYGSIPGSMHGRPAIIRYQGPTFRTVTCTFPLFYIKIDQSAELTQQIIEWFLSSMPVS